MPSADLILKIARLAGDERGEPRIREIALAKLATYRVAYPHLFVLPGQSANKTSWSDIPDVEGAREPPPAPPISPRDKARFLDIKHWAESANGNPTILITVKGAEYRVVLFAHKKSPTFGWLRIDTAAGKEAFSNMRYSTRGEAHLGAWEALCML